MDLFTQLKEYVPKRDKLKKMIASSGIPEPALITAIAFAGAAAIAVAACYLKPKKDHIISRDNSLEIDAINEIYPPSESQYSNCTSEAGEREEVKYELANGETNMVSLEEAAAQARDVVADMMQEYMEVQAEDVVTPVETPKA